MTSTVNQTERSGTAGAGKPDQDVSSRGPDSKNPDSFLEQANACLVNNYQYWPVQFERGEGNYLFDTSGKKYLDLAMGIAVSCLGYNYPGYNKTLQDQVSLLHSGLCYVASQTRINAAQKLVNLSQGLDQVFFCSTGTEAVEGCLKTARKWAYETKGSSAHEIIYVADSFHGRTMGALSVNGQEELRKGFGPFLPGMRQAVFNDIDSFSRLIGSDTAAVIIEPVLGEGGIVPANKSFLQDLRTLCDQYKTALIFDEIQCGMGRLGTLFAYQHYGVVPDLVAIAKSLGGGFPVGAFIGKREFTSHITPGSHGSTYGGGPLACRIVEFMLQELERPEIMKNVLQTGAYLKEQLSELADETGAFTNVRGIGMMLAADYTRGQIKNFIKASLQNGLVVLSCGKNSIRLLPAYILGPEEVDDAISLLRRTIRDLES